MRLATVSLLAMFSFFQGCQIGSPQKIQSSFEQALRPYFQNAKARAYPDRKQILALACIEGAGPQLVAKTAEILRNEPKISTLRMFTAYRTIVFGFDSGVVVFDITTGQIQYASPPAGWLEAYRNVCGLGPQSSSPQLASDAPPEPLARGTMRVWVGTFRVKLDRPVNGSTETTGQDSLGIYPSDAEFEANKQAEINTREGLIRSQFAARGFTVQSITLERIDKVRIGR